MRQKVTKSFITNHLTYSSWMYITLVVLATVGWGLVFTVTRYVPPAEKQLTIYFVSDFFNSDDVAPLEEDIRAAFPEIEEVGVYSVGISEYEGQQKFMLLMATGEVDLFIMDKAYVQTFASDGLALNLDEAFETGVLDIVDQADRVVVAAKADADLGVDGNPHVYAVSTADLYGLMGDFFFDNRNSVLLGMTMGGNTAELPELIRLFYEKYHFDTPPDYVEMFDRLLEDMRSQQLLQ